MRKAFSKLTALLAIAALSATFVACSDDDYSISQAEVDLDRTAVGQLSPSSSVSEFNLKTDADAEWTAAVEWDEDENTQPAYVWPKKGTGPAVLKIATLENLTQQVRKANLVISFPKDESKNIIVPITQNRAEATNDDEAKEREAGNMARGFGYGYNPWAGYCDSKCIGAPILRVDEMYDEEVLSYDWSDYKEDTREESGASVDELARKLNSTVHAGVSKGGFSSTIDAAFNGGQKRSASNEFAWLEMLVRTARPKVKGSMSDAILEYMTDEAYNHINGIKKVVRGKERVTYPSTDEGFLKLVKDYGPYMVKSGQLGGRLRTSVVANTSKITSAYNASASLEASYSGSFFVDVDVNATVKAQQASAQSRNHNGFYFQASVRGGSHSDGSFEALQSVLDKMSKARSGAGTEDDLVDDSETKVTIDDNSAEYEAAGAEWKRGLTTRFGLSESDVVNNIALIDFDSEDDLIPLYELVDRDLTEDEDGVDGEERYLAFKQWFDMVLLKDPSILTRQADLNSYVTAVPTKIEPLAQMTAAGTDESLIRDVYLSNGQHVARICSEFIPIINPSKRVSVIYPMVNGKCRYNLGIFCGDEASYPAKVSWGWEEDPSTPVVTSMAEYGKGLHNVAYLRGNHLTLEADPKFQDSQYATTTSSPYTLILKDKGEDVTYPLVKINDYVYTRSLYRARSYQNGATQMSDMVPYDVNSQNAFSVYSRYADATKNVDWYMVSNYTNSLHRWGGFAPQGWTVPYAGQYRKMLQNLADITGNKPDGTIGASFLTNGVYGFNTRATGFIGVGANVADNGKFERCVLANDKMLYLGAINDADKAKLDGTENTYGGRADLQTVYTCDALSIETATGNAAMTYFLDQPISYLDGHQIANSFFYPESIREKGEWNSYRDTKNVIEHAIWNNKNAKFDCAGYKLCFPVIICQRVVK